MFSLFDLAFMHQACAAGRKRGGCLLAKRRQWKKPRGIYLFNECNLAMVFRAHLLAAIGAVGFTLPIVPQKQWGGTLQANRPWITGFAISASPPASRRHQRA